MQPEEPWNRRRRGIILDEAADIGNPMAVGLAALWLAAVIFGLVPVGWAGAAWLLSATAGYLLALDRARRRWPADQPPES